MNKLFEEYLTYISGLKNYSPNTIIAYKNNLKIFEDWLNETDTKMFEVSTNDINMFVADISTKNFSPASLNQMLSTLRGFYRFAVRFKLTEINPADEVKNIKLPETLPNFLFNDEMTEFCKTPDGKKNMWPARDKAIFTSLYSTGCRVSELVNLDLKDLSNDFKSAIVFGKGSKERKVFFAEFAIVALKEYLLERKTLVNTMQTRKVNALFLNKRGTRITARGVEYIIERYAKANGIYKKITPHIFRHSFASMLLARGLDIRMVQELLGHESISTTQKYTHITSEQLQKLYHNAHPHGAVNKFDRLNETYNGGINEN